MIIISRFDIPSAPSIPEQTYLFKDIRVSVITDRIIRVEKSKSGYFNDNATQMVVCRNFRNTRSDLTEDKYGNIIISTESGAFRIKPATLATEAKINNKWKLPTNKTNMGGTARTLDGTFGILGNWKGKKERKDHFCLGHIRKGIFSSNGVAEIDDSKSFVFNEDGSVYVSHEDYTDKYVFAFGDDYLGGLKEFYNLCGKTPVLPKYALGNWWSRYHAYSDTEYISLMDRFKENNIPFTVATIDMDWHIVKNVPKDVKPTIIQGAGWTGYTFEESLFPDYKAFLKSLKERNLAVTMNLHPHDGVRYFEKQYLDMCEAVDQDPSKKEPVKFNLTDSKFRDAYFDILHHPYENDGVDFWWIDWQQGTESKEMLNLDPLWLLNHYHFIDSSRNGKNGIILSRYAGLGSHRYPVGFSGDTIVCWKSLNLQPWFTANASNAGYTWWSHDIGGHMLNFRDNELYLRWIQYGVFSPINRLHSNNKSISKEPWNYPEVEKTVEDFLRLRHRLIPYIYSANVRTSSEGIPLVSPMYYYDKSETAYNEKYRNQYFFGDQLIVAPVTRKTKQGVPNVDFYLPEGEWTDIFTGKTYMSGEYSICCSLDSYPVFARSGAIIPMLPESDGNNIEFTEIDLVVYKGNNVYTLYDDNDSYIEFKISGDKVSASHSENCTVKKINIKYKNSEKSEETINL